MERMAWAVVGAAYGDEGKGLATDALASMLVARGRKVMVARANGGAQAGHTVVTPEGARHVFHHVGSGSFAGASTHLTRFFAVHPTAFLREMATLVPLTGAFAVTADPDAPVTTPWDMLINQIVESHRAGGRHGSCGLGFGETLERDEKGPRLRVRDLGRAGFDAAVRAIRDEWVPARLGALGVDTVPEPFASALAADGVADAFARDVLGFLANVERVPDAESLGGADAVVFEGAQGLRLDQDFGAFPHVTRSNTGLRNPATLAHEAGIGRLEVLHMTRAYATRHGAGPFPGEMASVPGVRVEDPTNAPNAWQGTLRVGPVDADALREAIAWDVADARARGVTVETQLGVTHLDCLDAGALMAHQGAMVRPDADVFAQTLAGAVGTGLGLTSFGPSRATVSMVGAGG